MVKTVINTDGLDAIARFVKENPRFVFSGISLMQTDSRWYATATTIEIDNQVIEIDEIRDDVDPYIALCKIGTVIDEMLDVLGIPMMMDDK